MKLCWDNLEGMYLTNNGYLKKGTNIYVEEESCIICGDPFLRPKYKETLTCSQSCAMRYTCGMGKHPWLGRKHSDEYITRMKNIRIGESNPFFW